MPTTITKTIKPAGGGDFTSINSWDIGAGIRKNLITADEISVAECYSGGNLVTGAFALTSVTWVTDSTHYIEFKAAAGHEHTGVFTTTKAYAQVTGGANAVITVTKFLHITNLQLDMINNTGGNGTVRNNGTSTTTIDRCIIRFDGVVGSGDNTTLYFSVSGANGLITNSFIVNYSGATNGHVVGVWVTGGTVTVENCTLIQLNVLGAGKTSTGILTDNAGSSVTSQNNYIHGTLGYRQTLGTISKGANDATSDTSATTASLRSIAYTTANFQNVTQGSENLRLTQDSALKAQGANLSFTFDIGGQAWNNPPSIGGDEVDVISVFPAYIGGYLIGGAKATLNALIGGYIEGDVNLTLLARIGGYTLGSPRGSGMAILGGYVLGPAQLIDSSGIIGGYAFGAKSITPVYLGGFVFCRPNDETNNVGLLGGYVKAPDAASVSGILGGYMTSFFIQSATPAIIGGYDSALYAKSGLIGGYVFGFPSGNHYVESRIRTLVKVKSDEVVDQGLDIDATMTLIGLSQNDFNAMLHIEGSSASDFNAKVNVQKVKTPPTVVILSATPEANLVNGVRKVTVVASGYLGDGFEWTSASIDFSEPFLSTDPVVFAESASISGFSGPPPWTTSHDYHASGVYLITARGSDNFGMNGMDGRRINLASGATYPFISISATPRSGQVPDPLLVTFSVVTSGVGGLKTPGDKNILWSFGNKEFTQTTNPKTYYAAPGHYVAKLVWRYISPNGSIIYVSDGLTIGYNNA